MDGHIVRCGIICPYQSAATSEIVKALVVTSLTYVRSAIACTRPVPLPFTFLGFAAILAAIEDVGFWVQGQHDMQPPPSYSTFP